MTSKTKTTAAPTVNDLPDVDDETRAAERMREIETAKAEHALLKAWKRDGENGDRPATPTLDAMNERYVAAGCAPGSSASKRARRSSTSTPREPKMSETDLVRRLRELLDATPNLSQSAATSTLTAEGATIRQVRAAYKTETANRPKVQTPAKTTAAKAPAKKSTPKKAAAKSTPAKKAAPAKKTTAKKQPAAVASSTTARAASAARKANDARKTAKRTTVVSNLKNTKSA